MARSTRTYSEQRANGAQILLPPKLRATRARDPRQVVWQYEHSPLAQLHRDHAAAYAGLEPPPTYHEYDGTFRSRDPAEAVRKMRAEIQALRDLIAAEDAAWGKSAPSLVYFIRRASDGVIKIGVSRDVTKRLGGLQTSTPDELSLVGTIPGDERVEAEWHARFAAAHIRGEWFRPVPDLLAAIAALRPNKAQEIP